MRLLHVITSTGVGGAQVMLLRYLQALGPDAKNHQVLALGPRGDLSDPLKKLGVHVENLDIGGAFGSILSARRLRKRVSDLAPDLIVGWMYHGCMAAQISTFGRSKTPPVVWSVHHSLDDVRNEKKTTQAIIRALAALSTKPAKIIYCSKASKAQHEAIGYADLRASVIPNGIETDVFVPNDSRHRWLAELCGIPDDRFIIGNIARAHPMKDHETFVRVINGLLQRGIDCQGVLVGHGHQDGPAELLASELGISERVTILGGRDDIQHVAAGLDVFLLSSAWGEAFPLAIGEAMSCGIPCVATDVGDTAFLIADCGTVVPPNDPKALADAVEKMLSLSPEDRKQLGEKGRARVAEEFSINEYANKHAEVFARAKNS